MAPLMVGNAGKGCKGNPRRPAKAQGGIELSRIKGERAQASDPGCADETRRMKMALEKAIRVTAILLYIPAAHEAT